MECLDLMLRTGFVSAAAMGLNIWSLIVKLNNSAKLGLKWSFAALMVLQPHFAYKINPVMFSVFR